MGVEQVSDEGEIEELINRVLQQNPKMVEDYKNGKEKLFGFFVGQVMKESKGKANPQIVNKILKDKLNNDLWRGGRVAEGDGLLNRYRW